MSAVNTHIVIEKQLEHLQNILTRIFNQALSREMGGLLKRFDEERRSFDAASSAKLDQVLRLVSSTLSDNVEKNLTRIVSESIKSDVLPTINETTSAAVGKQLKSTVSQQLGAAINTELRNALPKAVTSALQQAPVMKSVADAVSQQLGPLIGAEINKALQTSLIPVIEDLARGTKKMETDMERHFKAQIQQLEAQHRNDQAKMEEMSAMLRSLTTTVNALAANQGQAQVQPQPQVQVQRRQNEHPGARQASQQYPENRAHTPQRPVNRSTPQPIAPVAAPHVPAQQLPIHAPAPPPVQPPVQAQAQPQPPTPASAAPTPEQAELAEINRMFATNQFEEASIKVRLLSYSILATPTNFFPVDPIQPTGRPIR